MIDASGIVAVVGRVLAVWLVLSCLATGIVWTLVLAIRWLWHLD